MTSVFNMHGAISLFRPLTWGKSVILKHPFFMIIASRRRMGIYIAASMHIFFCTVWQTLKMDVHACVRMAGGPRKRARERERDRGEEKESDQCAGCQWWGWVRHIELACLHDLGVCAPNFSLHWSCHSSASPHASSASSSSQHSPLPLSMRRRAFHISQTCCSVERGWHPEGTASSLLLASSILLSGLSRQHSEHCLPHPVPPPRLLHFVYS